MKRFLFLLISIFLTAASCNISDPLSISTGSKGIFLSEDGGESFHPSNNLDRKGDIGGVSINTLALNPKDSDIMYIGHGSGIHKSEDGGKTWTFILTGIAIADLVVDPNSENIVYGAGITANNGKIIKSFDSGKTWIDIYSEPSKGNSVLTITVGLTNSKVIVAGLNTGELIRSTDEGHTWQLVKDLQNRVLKARFASGNTVYVLSRNNGLYKSTDSGVNWTQSTQSLTSDSLFSQTNQITSVSVFHDLALDNRLQGVIYLATEQGLLRTVNDGGSWAFISLPLKNSQLSVS